MIIKNDEAYDDFNLTSGNLGWDLESLEKGCLFWTHGGDLSWDINIKTGDGTGLSWGLDLVLGDDLADLAQVHGGEDETDVQLNIWQQVDEVWVVLELTTDALLHHGVLAHENFGLSSQRDTDLLHLVGADVVSADNEALWVLIEHALHLREKPGFPYFTIFLNHLCICVLGMTDISLLKLSKNIKRRGEFIRIIIIVVI